MSVPLAAVVALGTGCGHGKAITSPAPVQEATTTTVAGGVDLTGARFVDDSKESKVAVQANDNVFDAPYITVKAGTKITFRNAGHNEHNIQPVVSGEFKATSTDAFQPGDTATIDLTEPGVYPYYCSLHGNAANKGMVGAIRVLS